MKSTGMVRRIDDLGRVVIPKELRRTHNIHEGDPLEIFTDRDNIVLRKYRPEPWTYEDFKNALAAVCKEFGKNPADYLEAVKEGQAGDAKS